MNIGWQPGVTLDEIEKRIILYAYRFYGNDKTKTASALGRSVRTIANKLAEYGTIGAEEAAAEEGKAAEVSATARVQVEPVQKLPPQQAVHMRKREEVQKVSRK